MDGIRIKIQDGTRAQSWVDPFYERYGSRGRARPGDIFFLAMIQSNLVGCVRYCVEEGTPLLRTMMIDESFRRKGIGLALLEAFASFLDKNHIRDVFCLPYAHLDGFYGSIGFQQVEPAQAPSFLADRLADYLNGEKKYICMRRP